MTKKRTSRDAALTQSRIQAIIRPREPDPVLVVAADDLPFAFESRVGLGLGTRNVLEADPVVEVSGGSEALQ
jgi:hypothetical protein